MRFFALLCTWLLAAGVALAQAESEPNNSQATADSIAEGATVTGTVGNTGDIYDYFVTVPLNDGTVNMQFSFNRSAGGDDFFVYAFNKNGTIIGSVSRTNTLSGSDSLILYCRQADTIYFRTNSSGVYTYQFSYSTLPSGTGDLEPNDLFTTAVDFQSSDTVRGRIGYASVSTDFNDYFRSALPDDGTLVYYLEYNNTSNSTDADLWSYIYNKNGTIIASSARTNQPLGISYDTIYVYGRAEDTVYFRLNASGCFSYEFHYELIPSGIRDPEPNGLFTTPVDFLHTDTVRGRIGYTSVVTDVDDYFRSALPDDGTLVYYLEYNNTSNSTDADLWSYIYNKGGTIIGLSARTNQPLGISYDTIYVYGRAEDTVYFRLNTAGSFSYEFHYDLIPSGTRDPEPNDLFTTAVDFLPTDTIRGRIGYSSVATDFNDYFRSALPDDGTLVYYLEYNNTSNSTGADLWSYIYNKNGTIIASSARTNQPLGISYDTIYVYGRAEDTVYFRITANDGSFSYEFHYDLIPSGTRDPEPNDLFTTAVDFLPTDTVRGRIGYASVATDNNDYFRSALPDDGTLVYYLEYNNTSNSTDADLWSYIYNKNGTIIASSAKTNQPLGISYDTVRVYCRAADTVYFRINTGGSFSYAFHYEVIPSGTADAEPNGTFATATYFAPDTSVKGRIGYVSVAADNDDYFKTLAPVDGSMRIIVDYTNPGPFSTPDFWVLAYNKNGTQIGSLINNNRPPGSYRDTLEVNCRTSDTTWIRINSSGCFSYEFSVETNKERPEATIDVFRFGNKASFSSQVTNATSVLWNLGGGDQSNLRFPVKDYPVGVHPVSFTATNAKCNFSLTLRDTIAVEGIEDYSPKRAGTDDGLGFFTLKLFGAGLDTMATIELKQGGTTLRPSRMASPATQEVAALFSLKNVPLGMYDIEVTFSSGQQFFIPNGFEIYAQTKAWRVYTRLNGPSRIRTGREVNFAIDVVNENGYIANGVRLFVIVPRGVETNIDEILYQKSGKLSIKGNDWNLLSIDAMDFEDTYFQGNFDPNTDTVLVDWDEIYANFDSLISYDIDQLYNEPYQGTVYPLFIPFINANSTYTLNFKVKSSSNQQFPIISYVWPYSYRKNPIDDCTLGYIHDLGLQGAALAELAPNPALRAVGKSAGYVDIGSQIAFTEFFDWYYGVNNADATFYGRQSIALAGELSGEIAPFKGKKNFDNAMDQINFSKRALKNSTEFKSILQQTITGGGRLSPNMASRLSKELGYLNDILAGQAGNLSNSQKQAAINAARHVLEKNGLNFSSNQLQDLLFPKDKPGKVNEPEEKEEKPVQSLTSFDPNAIYGNEGAGAERWVRRTEQLNYMITFENVDTAQAPAAVVRIVDTLDPAVYDLSQTTLGYVNIAGVFYQLEEDRQSFFRDIDLRPAQDLIVRINAAIDTLTGVLSWEFVSLDPLTMDLPIDPLIGFLPPNVNYPEGEGSVMFHTRLLPSVAHEDTASTSALIYFDVNEPIATNIWKHHVDEVPPVAGIDPNIRLDNDTTFTLTLRGGDTESGLERFLLYVKEDGGVWNGYGFKGENGLEVEVIGELGKAYEAYVLGIDSVGNRSDVSSTTAIRFTLVSIPPDHQFSAYLQAGPNPFSDMLDVFTPERNVEELTLLDMNGRIVLRKNSEGLEECRLDMSHLARGMYVLRGLLRSGESVSVKVMKQ